MLVLVQACVSSPAPRYGLISPQIVGYRKFTASSVLALVASAVRHGTPVRALGALPHVLCWMRAVKACCAAATMVYLLEEEKHV